MIPQQNMSQIIPGITSNSDLWTQILAAVIAGIILFILAWFVGLGKLVKKRFHSNDDKPTVIPDTPVVKDYKIDAEKAKFDNILSQLKYEIRNNYQINTELKDFFEVAKANDEYTYVHAKEMVNRFSKDAYNRWTNLDYDYIKSADLKTEIYDFYKRLSELSISITAAKEKQKLIFGKYAPPDAQCQILKDGELKKITQIYRDFSALCRKLDQK